MDLSVLLTIIISCFAFLILSVNMHSFLKILKAMLSDKSDVSFSRGVQLFIIAILTAIFCTIFVYYLINPESVDRIDIILTVVIGWLGLIIGKFF